MRTANPALTESVFVNERAITAGSTMTVSGTVNRTFVLLVLVIASATWSWGQSISALGEWETTPTFVPTPWMWGGALGGFVMALVTIFKKAWAPVTAPIYALLEGLFLGAVSAGFELRFPGIVMQAVTGTFGTLLGLLLAYRSGLIRVTENFKLGLFAATGGIAFLYLISIVMGFFGRSIPFIHESSPIGIGFSVVVVVIAALNLVLDFDFIENGERVKAPKYMEWYGAFGLMVTLIWLYLEMLRLISKVRDRR
jgi:uncharacterized YccA/Bax inhibitor family protein